MSHTPGRRSCPGSAPLRLLRLELYGETVECDWVARPADPWDMDLAPSVSERHASAQALDDAIAIRELLFRLLPDVWTCLVSALQIPLIRPRRVKLPAQRGQVDLRLTRQGRRARLPGEGESQAEIPGQRETP